MIPEELLSSIFAFLPARALASVATVCSTFRRIAEPLLYANPDLRVSAGSYQHESTDAHYKTSQLLHRSLQNRGNLASCIKSLTMESRNPTMFVDQCSASAGKKTLSLPNLTTLILVRAQITMVPLKTLLSMTPNLQNLEFDSECDCQPQDQFRMRYFDCDLLGSALAVVGGTLAKLKITVKFVASTALEPENGGSYETRESWGIKGSLGQSLQHFQRLESFDVPWAVLLGWSPADSLRLATCLPSGLRLLVLSHDLGYFRGYGWDEPMCANRLNDYLAGRDQAVDLQSLGIRYDDDDDDEEEDVDRNAWKVVEEQCHRVGCTFYLEGRVL